MIRLTPERGFRRLTVVLSFIVLALGVGLDTLIQLPHWDARATLKAGRVIAITNRTIVRDAAHTRDAWLDYAREQLVRDDLGPGYVSKSYAEPGVFTWCPSGPGSRGLARRA